MGLIQHKNICLWVQNSVIIIVRYVETIIKIKIHSYVTVSFEEV